MSRSLSLSVTHFTFVFSPTLITACTDRSPIGNERSGPEPPLLTAADSARFLATRTSAAMIAAAPPAGSTDRLAMYVGETITVTIIDAECSGIGDVMEVRGPVQGVVSTNACFDKGATITLGPASADGILEFVLTDTRYGSGPYAVTGSYPDYTVHVEDGYGDGDFNDNVLTVHFAPPDCPPTGDSILDSPTVRRGVRDALLSSNPDAAPGSGQKLERGGIIWQRPDGSFFTQDIVDPNATECTWTLPGPPTPPEPGAVGRAKYHTHPHSHLEPVYGCRGKYAQHVGDRFPPAIAVPDQNGGGSDSDWESGTSDGFPMYVINKDGRVYRLDPDTPKNARPNNANRWEWKKPSTAGCLTR